MLRNSPSAKVVPFKKINYGVSLPPPPGHAYVSDNKKHKKNVSEAVCSESKYPHARNILTGALKALGMSYHRLDIEWRAEGEGGAVPDGIPNAVPDGIPNAVPDGIPNGKPDAWYILPVLQKAIPRVDIPLYPQFCKVPFHMECRPGNRLIKYSNIFLTTLLAVFQFHDLMIFKTFSG